MTNVLPDIQDMEPETYEAIGLKNSWVEIKKSETHGFGVFLVQDMKEGDFTFMHGCVLPIAMCNDYCIILDENRVYEPYLPFRYLNHSETPNLEMEFDDGGGVWITAIRDIVAGEELTIYYGEGWEDA